MKQLKTHFFSIKKLLSIVIFVFLFITKIANATQPILVVAAENCYGDIAHQIGGDYVYVKNILSNIDQDPHIFEASPSIACQLETAKIVICNGAGYDTWIEKILNVSQNKKRHVIIVSSLIGKNNNITNPHFWYLPSTMMAVAYNVANYLKVQDPKHYLYYSANLKFVINKLINVSKRINKMRERHFGQSITATEPFFGYVADALGLKMLNTHFQLAIMNETEPSASDLALFESNLRNHNVCAMLYNSQTNNQMTRYLLEIAKQSSIPTIAITETQPTGKHFDTWMLEILDKLDQILS